MKAHLLRFAASAALLFNVVITAQAADDSIVIVTAGGVFEQAMKKNFYEPFTAKTGIRVIPVASGLGAQWAKVKAMADFPAAEWDIVTALPNDNYAQASYLEPIDCADLTNAAEFAIEGTCMGNGVLRTWGANVLAWNTDAFPEGKQPKNWADFWDVKNFPGPRAMPDASYWPWLLIAALEADGVPRDKLFPLDVERAFAKLDELKPEISVWWKTADQSQNVLRTGEAVMSMMGSGRAATLVQSGEPVSFTWYQGIKDIGMWGVLKNAKNKKGALEFINFYLANPEAHVAFSKEFPFETPNKKAIDLLTPEERQSRGGSAENLAVQIDPDWKWIADNDAEMRQRMIEYLSR
ncbi:ABC transporter substrate-binding protein [Paenochrobactrum sp. BZR 588]|uniref:ABC transporter substrate-binding protein n=1 Tax=Paenochrobactrum TaxID=999488 RepID=UPI0035BC88BD